MQDFLSWQSDLGGNSWLELAMALETVERTDEVNKAYYHTQPVDLNTLLIRRVNMTC